MDKRVTEGKQEDGLVGVISKWHECWCQDSRRKCDECKELATAVRAYLSGEIEKMKLDETFGDDEMRELNETWNCAIDDVIKLVKGEGK